MIKNSVLVYEKLYSKGLVFAALGRICIIKQDDYGDVELWLSEVDYEFGAETLRLDSSARIFSSKAFDRNLWNKPKRIMISSRYPEYKV